MPRQVLGHVLHARRSQNEGLLGTPSVAEGYVTGSGPFAVHHSHPTTLLDVNFRLILKGGDPYCDFENARGQFRVFFRRARVFLFA